MAADVGTLQRLPYLIPEGIVRELAYTGRKFSADEALRYGLINAVLDTHEAVIDHALDVAGEIVPLLVIMALVEFGVDTALAAVELIVNPKLIVTLALSPEIDKF